MKNRFLRTAASAVLTVLLVLTPLLTAVMPVPTSPEVTCLLPLYTV